ncbi:MAG: nucleotide sugar dehydrogenase [Proteobacteria bacterium]|nr:nucleotide sugar dehydrogenase [Pseudomonadota bacterium]
MSKVIKNSQVKKIAVVGLGYVGLPVAVAFGKKNSTIGFDINFERISQLREGFDSTGEVSPNDLEQTNIFFTNDINILWEANFYIIAVPTPVDDAKFPDLTILKKATEIVAKVLNHGDIVVYESTVYPGATEEECIPILEKLSSLQGGLDFKVGYSPERINPGDTEHTFTKIKKVVSCQDTEGLDEIAALYESVIEPGVYRAESIKVAEAAKVIENTQRDINIALMNELSVIFDKMDIPTHAVLEAAGTKWNFLPFTPGLVGGHCIGVDPYYLTYKAQKVGYSPQMILAGRNLNDGVGKFVAQQTIKKMIQKGHHILDNYVTVMGVTFKNNCPDIRNSKVFDIINELKGYGAKIQAYDPVADKQKTWEEYGVKLMNLDELQPAKAVIFAVDHDEFRQMLPGDILNIVPKNPVLIDVKGIFSQELMDENNICSWRL